MVELCDCCCISLLLLQLLRTSALGAKCSWQRECEWELAELCFLRNKAGRFAGSHVAFSIVDFWSQVAGLDKARDAARISAASGDRDL